MFGGVNHGGIMERRRSWHIQARRETTVTLLEGHAKDRRLASVSAGKIPLRYPPPERRDAQD
jgi:hypothetical protein